MSYRLPGISYAYTGVRPDNQAWMDNVTSGDYQKYDDDMYKNR